MKQSRRTIILVCAVALFASITLIGWLVVVHNRQSETGINSSTIMAAEDHFNQRIEEKKKEMDRQGVTGAERERQLQWEKQAAALELKHNLEGKSGSDVRVIVVTKH